MSEKFKPYYPDDLISIWEGEDGEMWRKTVNEHRESVKTLARASLFLKTVNGILVIAIAVLAVFMGVYVVAKTQFSQLEQAYTIDGSSLVCAIDEYGIIRPKNATTNNP